MTATAQTSVLFPEAGVLQRLAISESGFVFDPVTGQSFSASSTAIRVLRLACAEQPLPVLVAQLAAEYDAPPARIERDLHDFAASLRNLLK